MAYEIQASASFHGILSTDEFCVYPVLMHYAHVARFSSDISGERDGASSPVGLPPGQYFGTIIRNMKYLVLLEHLSRTKHDHFVNIGLVCGFWCKSCLFQPALATMHNISAYFVSNGCRYPSGLESLGQPFACNGTHRHMLLVAAGDSLSSEVCAKSLANVSGQQLHLADQSVDAGSEESIDIHLGCLNVYTQCALFAKVWIVKHQLCREMPCGHVQCHLCTEPFYWCV